MGEAEITDKFEATTLSLKISHKSSHPAVTNYIQNINVFAKR